jgi:ActR/RegA family two-component response regulator
MSEHPNWHDAHALMLIDQALEQGTFTAELVAQINQALAAARQADPTYRIRNVPVGESTLCHATTISTGGNVL